MAKPQVSTEMDPLGRLGWWSVVVNEKRQKFVAAMSVEEAGMIAAKDGNRGKYLKDDPTILASVRTASPMHSYPPIGERVLVQVPNPVQPTDEDGVPINVADVKDRKAIDEPVAYELQTFKREYIQRGN